EFPFVFVAPFLRHLMRRMRRSGREIEEERFVRRLRFLTPNPIDRMLDHRVVEIEILVCRHADDRVVLSQHRIELAGFASEKTPEIIEAERIGPAIERPGWPLLVVRCQVPLADRSGVVAVELKNLRDGCSAGGPIRVVPGPTAGDFSNRSESYRMMIPS